jgi:Uma2 family endonuclease
MVTERVHFRFTTDEYEQMIATGILTEEDRVELIDGEIIAMSPINVRHAACVKRLNELFSDRKAKRYIVGVQDPIRLDERSVPEPNVVLLRRRPDFYRGGHPEPEDVILIIEVADTSLAYDQGVKASLYARASIEEFWLVNLAENNVVVYREPGPNGYASQQAKTEGMTISPATLPDIVLTVDDIID